MRARSCGGQRSIGVVVMIMIWILLTACGQASSDQSGGAGAPDPNAPASNTDPSAPAGPDSPVTGFPGQPGAPASGAAIRGRVIDAAGQPVAGVLVVPQSTDTPSLAIPEIAVMTNEQGEYQWSLPPGAYTLTFNAEGYVAKTETVNLGQGQIVVRDVTLQKP